MQKKSGFEIVYQEGGFMSAKRSMWTKRFGVNSFISVSGCGRISTPLLDAEGETRRHQETAGLRRSRFLLSGAKRRFDRVILKFQLGVTIWSRRAGFLMGLTWW